MTWCDQQTSNDCREREREQESEGNANEEKKKYIRVAFYLLLLLLSFHPSSWSFHNDDVSRIQWVHARYAFAYWRINVDTHRVESAVSLGAGLRHFWCVFFWWHFETILPQQRRNETKRWKRFFWFERQDFRTLPSVEFTWNVSILDLFSVERKKKFGTHKRQTFNFLVVSSWFMFELFLRISLFRQTNNSFVHVFIFIIFFFFDAENK